MKYGKSRKGAAHKKTGCPFTLIFKKTEDIATYQLVKFRSAHNHPLDELPDEYSGINQGNYGMNYNAGEDYGNDYNLSKSMNIKQDGYPYQQRVKREDNTEDYSLEGLPSNETTNGKDSMQKALSVGK